jgi:hypothetical protein
MTRTVRALLAALLLVGSSFTSAAAATPDGPTGLTATQKQTLLDGMSKEERKLREADFTNKKNVVLAYTRAFQRTDASGAPIGDPITVDPYATGPTPLGQEDYNGLWMSLSAIRNTSQPNYTYDIRIHYDWHSDMDLGGEDSLGTAWAGGMALISDSHYGFYRDGKKYYGHRETVSANAGVSWSFYEYYRACGGCTTYRSNYGYLDARIRKGSFGNKDTNVIGKYFHTFQNLEYSLSISGTPSISISPTTSQWSLALYVTIKT